MCQPGDLCGAVCDGNRDLACLRHFPARGTSGCRGCVPGTIGMSRSRIAIIAGVVSVAASDCQPGWLVVWLSLVLQTHRSVKSSGKSGAAAVTVRDSSSRSLTALAEPWRCDLCTFDNTEGGLYCEMCGSPRSR